MTVSHVVMDCPFLPFCHIRAATTASIEFLVSNWTDTWAGIPLEGRLLIQLGATSTLPADISTLLVQGAAQIVAKASLFPAPED